MLKIDTKDWMKFNRLMRASTPALAVKLRAQLRIAGQLIADAASENVDPFSESIPPSIKVRLAGAKVSVVAGGSGVPLAGLFEEGNAGKSGGTTFRHPVFGNRDVWIEQAMHPYLQPALEQKEEEAEALIAAAIDDTINAFVAG